MRSPAFESDDAEKRSGDSEFIRFPLPSESFLRSLVKKEKEYVLKSDYLNRLLSERQLSARRNYAINWMWKVHAFYKFGPLSAYLCVNYLDRFLSYYDFLPEEDQPWSTQLLSVACLSVAVKMEKVEAPPARSLQICEPKHVFKTQTITQMEFALLSKLEWRTQAVTPFTYIDFFLYTISGGHPPSHLMISRCTEIILNTVRVIDMMEFWPSEVAASTALLVLRDAKAVDVVENFPNSLVSKRKVWQCYGVIRYLEMARQLNHLHQAPASSPVPESPLGVLDCDNLSNKSDDRIGDQSHKTSGCKRKANRSAFPSKRMRIIRIL